MKSGVVGERLASTLERVAPADRASCADTPSAPPWTKPTLAVAVAGAIGAAVERERAMPAGRGNSCSVELRPDRDSRPGPLAVAVRRRRPRLHQVVVVAAEQVGRQREVLCACDSDRAAGRRRRGRGTARRRGCGACADRRRRPPTSTGTSRRRRGREPHARSGARGRQTAHGTTTVSPGFSTTFCATFLPLRHVAVVELERLGLPFSVAHDRDVLPIGVLGQAAGDRDELQHGHLAGDRVGARPRDLAGDEDVAAVDLPDDDRDVRVGDELGGRLAESPRAARPGVRPAALMSRKSGRVICRRAAP